MTPPPSVLWFFVNGQWRQQNVDTEFSLYVFKDGVWTQDTTEIIARLDSTWQT